VGHPSSIFERIVTWQERIMLKSSKDVLSAGDVSSVVDFAIELHREVTQLTKELEALKPYLRAEGVKRQALSGENSVEIAGKLGVATIVGVKPVPMAKKGMDLASLEASLPPEVFHSLFVKRVAVVVDIAADYETKALRLNPAQKAVLSNYVEITTSTPRVNLPK
jgi:hypothetical protein